MKKNKPALKPCPFCGSEAHYYYQRENEIIVCDECGAKLTYFGFGEDGHRELEKQWNSRPIEDALEEENARLREALEAILDATQKEKVSIPVLRFVAYTALKGEGNGA